MNGDGNGYVEIDDATLERCQLELGYSKESLENLTDRRLARMMQKLKLGDRPRLREEHELGALRGNDGTIPNDGPARAEAQLGQLMRASASLAGEVAGVPAGATRLSADGPVTASMAGLSPTNTGWTALGPGNIGGRVRSMVIDPTNTDRLFVGGVGGGVWRSTDGGSSWAPTDDLMANLAVCSLCMDPTDPNRIYAGTGEGFFNSDAIRGDGIFLTTDGGNTWTQLASTRSNPDFFFVNSLAISNNGQTLLAGTGNGIFRSLNGGASWNREANFAVGNVTFDPASPNNAIAGERSGGRAHFSTNGGDSWQEAARPSSNGGRVQVCYSAANSMTTYASVEVRGGLAMIWRSTDGGQSYTQRATNAGGANYLGGQGWYDNVIWAGDPTDADLVIVGGVDLWKSTNGGDSLTTISRWWQPQSAHADHHLILADPDFNGGSNRRVFFCNDGGVYRTDNVTTVGNDADRISGWVNLNSGLEITQFFYGGGHIRTDVIMGGAQDNGTLRYRPALGSDDWDEVWGGDGGDIASDPGDAQVWYGEYVFLQIFRDTTGGNSPDGGEDSICGIRWDPIARDWVWKPLPFKIPEAEQEKAQFIAPFELDPNNSDRLLGGALSLWRTDDAKTPNTAGAGPSWTSIKPPIGNDSRNDSITAIAIADGDSDVVFVGHANGRIYRSGNATGLNPAWQRVDNNGIGIGASRQCLSLTIDPDDHDLAYASFGGFEPDNLWRTDNGGQSWIDISGGLPDAAIRDVALHPQRSSWIYLATEVGVFASEDGGNTWSPTNEGPANVSCRDLFWMRSKLVCVTHGRGMFETDIPISNPFPDPILTFTGSQNTIINGAALTQYNLSVTNRSVFPDSLFRPSPDLPPCGTTSSASRTWVDVFNGDTNQRMQSFCALGRADDLDDLWFRLPQGATPPGSVFIRLNDRRCQSVLTSNQVSLGVVSPTPLIFSGGLVNSASYLAGSVSPGELLSIFGNRLGPQPGIGAQLTPAGNISTLLGSTRVLFNGQPGPMLFASESQINVVAPFGLVGQQAVSIQVEVGGILSNTVSVPVAATNPAVYSLTQAGSGQAAAVNQNGMVNGPGSPAPPGTAIQIYLTGGGVLAPPAVDGEIAPITSLHTLTANVDVQIGGANAQVLFSGAAPGNVFGVVQINAAIPQGAAAGNAESLTISIGGVATQAGITIAVG